MKYWNKEGKHQDLHDKYWDELVPDSGEAETQEGEALRAISRIYYDVYNNGACNIFETEEVYDDDGEYECDEYTMSDFYRNFFDTIHAFTNDGSGVHALIGRCKRCAQGYWPEDLGFMLDNFMDTILKKIDNNDD